MIDTDETPEAVAIRETREETGLGLIGEPIVIQCYLPSAGGSDESVVLFCGRVDSHAAHGIHGLADEHEDIKVVVLSYRDAMRRLRDGAIINSPTMIALYWLAANRARLRRSWCA